MKKYLGYVLKQNYYYYNFYPVYVFDNKIEKITSPVVDFPQKGNINLFSQPHAQHKCADVFQENQVALIEFSQNDLLENRRGEQLNQTEKKLDVDELYNRNRIHFLRDIDLFPVVHLAAKLDFSGASNLVLEDNIQNSEDVLVEEDSTLYGPYKLDSNHQIKVCRTRSQQGLGQARPNKTAFAQQEGGALPRQVPAEAPLGTVNKQRQGIITVMIPCLLILSYPRFHSADRKLYCGLRAFEVLMDHQSFFSAVRAKKLARTAPEMLCHTENTAPGMVASGYCAK